MIQQNSIGGVSDAFNSAQTGWRPIGRGVASNQTRGHLVNRSSRHGPRRQWRTRYEYDINAAPIVGGTGLTVRGNYRRPEGQHAYGIKRRDWRTVVDFASGRHDLVRDDSHGGQLCQGAIGDFKAAQGLGLVLGQAADDKVSFGTGEDDFLVVAVGSQGGVQGLRDEKVRTTSRRRLHSTRERSGACSTFPGSRPTLVRLYGRGGWRS